MSRFLQILLSFLSLIIYLPFINANTKDTCAVVVAVLPTGPTTTGNIAQCLCENSVADAIVTNPILAQFEAIVGQAGAEAVLDGLIEASPDVQMCHYPDDSIPQCTMSDVCAFICISGTTLCQEGNSRGQCKKACPSAGGDDDRRRHQLPMPTPASRCPANHEMCRFGNSYKCVDIQTNLVSCGGCMNTRLSQRGQDCSEIPGVDVVSCDAGVCNVKSCIKGYTFNPERHTCSLNR